MHPVQEDYTVQTIKGEIDLQFKDLQTIGFGTNESKIKFFQLILFQKF